MAATRPLDKLQQVLPRRALRPDGVPLQWEKAQRVQFGLGDGPVDGRGSARCVGGGCEWPEALWTISVYLKEWRDEQRAVSAIRGADSWELTSLHFNNCVIRSDTSDHQPTIAAVMNRTHNRVLAFRDAAFRIIEDHSYQIRELLTKKR